jgi:hypothetical protein
MKRKDDWTDQHPHQVDESVAERLERFGKGRPEDASRNAEPDGNEDLHIEHPVPSLRAAGWGGG